jgi:hypothetical protein
VTTPQDVQAQHVRIGDYVVFDNEIGRSVRFVSGILLDAGRFTLRCNSGDHFLYIRNLPADRLVNVER